MRIGFFVWEYPPRIVSGMGTYAENICQALKNLGHEISVFTMNDGTLKTRETVKGIEVNRPMLVAGGSILPPCVTEDLKKWGAGTKLLSDVLIYNVLSATKFVNQLIKKEGIAFDIISAHDWYTGLAGIMIKQETGLPFVFHLHSTKKDRSVIIRHIEQTAARVADRVMTVCYPRYDYLAMRGFDATKMTVCWNAVNVTTYDPDRLKTDAIEALRKSYGLGPADEMLLFVGELAPESEIINVVKAMPAVISKYPGVKLVILGRGELEQFISTLISDLKIGDRVKTRFEIVPEEEKILHYGACDMVICPSRYEPCSIISLEAMAMAKPIVVCSKGICYSCDHVITSGEDQTGILVDGGNAADIAWGINTLLENRESAKEMGERGRKRVKEFFTWDKIAEHTIRVYEEVIREVGTSRRVVRT